MMLKSSAISLNSSFYHFYQAFHTQLNSDVMKFSVVFIYALLLVVAFSACERKVDIKIEYEGNRLVMNSLVQPDSFIYVRITRSVPVNVYDESAFREIDNVTVNIRDDKGNEYPATNRKILGKSYFVTSTPAVLGRKYSITAAAAGLSPVAAADTLPTPPEVYHPIAKANSSRIKFTLKDAYLSRNYYRIRVFSADSNGLPLSALLFRLDPAFNNNIVDILSSNHATSLVMNDNRFDGRELTFVLQTQDQLPNTGKLMVEVTALTYDAYQYLKTVTSQQLNVGDIVSEPTRVYSNVTDGYGIVAGINAKKLVFKADN
jgi:hypothetical protein